MLSKAIALLLALGILTSFKPYHSQPWESIRAKISEDQLCEDFDLTSETFKSLPRKLVFRKGDQIFTTLTGARICKRLFAEYQASLPPKETTYSWWEKHYHDTKSKSLMKMGRQLPITATCNMGEDALHDLVERNLRRGAMDHHLARSKKVYPSTVAGWAVRQGISNARDDAGNPAFRAIFGGTKPQERARRKIGQWDSKTMGSTPQGVLEGRWGLMDEGDTLNDSLDMDRIGVETSPDVSFELERAIGSVEGILTGRLRVPEGDLPLYRRIMISRFGETRVAISDIAEELAMRGSGVEAMIQGCLSKIEQAFHLFREEVTEEMELIDC